MQKQLSLKWNLDSLFQGGSHSLQLSTALNTLDEDLEQLENVIRSSGDIINAIQKLQDIESLKLEIESFIACLIAQDVTDQEAYRLNEHLTSSIAFKENLSGKLVNKLLQLSDSDFEKLLSDSAIQPVAYTLKEKRKWAKEKLIIAQEQVINGLSINGYYGWEKTYDSLMGSIKIKISDGVTVQEMSVGQADNRLGNPSRTVRKDIFRKLQSTWKSQENLFCQILNHLSGFRLNVYEERGWNNVLKEPLFFNRMHEKTLNIMWDTISKNKSCLLPYLAAKAKLIGVNKLSWYDMDASLPTSHASFIPFDEAAETIIKNFSLFNADMGEFAKQAFNNKWIEAEDRSGKMPGGFCSFHPIHKESRIFLTYSGTMNNVFTLAHELGHAYHNAAVKDLPTFSQQYGMNVAETASTLAEMVLIDSTLKKCSDPVEKLSILDNKLQRSVTFLMNIHARFLFEMQFYEKRKNGFVLATEINEMMESAQKEAYLDALEEWNPYFWVSKKHFYITEIPFYNFPYTFGYLFSLGLYAIALETGKDFENKYRELLKDTGRMDVEDLANKHLGVDLTQPYFWQKGLNLIEKDVEDFVELANKSSNPK